VRNPAHSLIRRLNFDKRKTDKLPEGVFYTILYRFEGGAMLKNLSIKTKLFMILVLPILALVLLSGMDIYRNYILLNEMKSISTLTELSVHISHLVHETQRERGRTAGYLGSKTDSDKQKLIKERVVTDKYIKELNGFLKTFQKDKYSKKFGQRLDSALSDLTKIANIRQKVDSLDIPLSEAIGYFTNMNARFLSVEQYISLISTNAELSTLSSAYVNFLMSKERAGIERAVLTNAFAQNKFPNRKIYRKFSDMVSEQKVYIDVFLSFASDEEIEFYQSKMKDPSVAEVKRIEEIAFEKSNEGNFGVDANHWFNTISKKIDILKEVEDKLSDDFRKKASALQAKASQELITYIIIALTVFLVSIIWALMVNNSITKPLHLAVENLKDIAQGEGDLTRKMDDRSRSELGLLGRYFNAFVEKLTLVIHSIHDVAISLSATSEQINASAVSLAEGSQNQAASVEQTSATMEEFASTVKQITNNVNDLKDQSEQVNSIVDKSIPRIQEAKVSIEKISDNSQKIRDIVRVINDIADQTNLLSLNASIEAARAGEYGRGFSVVAEEISKLAERSATSTKEIEQLIKVSMADVTNGVQLVGMASDAFEDIAKGVGDTARYVADITQAIEQQEQGTIQVVDSINHINTITETTAAGSEEMSASTAELQTQAEKLSEMINQFKTSGQGESSGQSTGLTVQERASKIRPLFVWDDSFSVNLKDIDKQHLVLVDIINDLHRAMLTGQANDKLGDIFKGLLDYTNTHFRFEEDLMRKHDYPGLEMQERQHIKFVNKMTDVYEDFKSGTAMVSMQTLDFLKDWLTSHIKRVDMEFKHFFNDRGVY